MIVKITVTPQTFYSAETQTPVVIDFYTYYDTEDPQKRIYQVSYLINYEGDSVTVGSKITGFTGQYYGGGNGTNSDTNNNTGGTGLTPRRNGVGELDSGNTPIVTDAFGNPIVYERGVGPRGADEPRYFTDAKGTIVSEMKGISKYKKKDLYVIINKGGCSAEVVDAVAKRLEDVQAEAAVLKLYLEQLEQPSAVNQLLGVIAPTIGAKIQGGEFITKAIAYIATLQEQRAEKAQLNTYKSSIEALEKEYNILNEKLSACRIDPKLTGFWKKNWIYVVLTLGGILLVAYIVNKSKKNKEVKVEKPLKTVEVNGKDKK